MLWDDGQSPRYFLIKKAYQEAYAGWNNQKIAKLARRLNCTLIELCALAGVFNKARVKKWHEEDKWPIEVVIHFSKLDQFLLARSSGGVALHDAQDAAAAKLVCAT